MIGWLKCLFGFHDWYRLKYPYHGMPRKYCLRCRKGLPQ